MQFICLYLILIYICCKMKTIITIICLTFGINLYAQEYTPLLTAGKYWDIVYWEQGGVIPQTGGQRQFISGDTLLNGIQYKIISARSFMPTNPGPFAPPFTLSASSGIAGFMREDTINRKVYTVENLNLGDISEQLTYDFSLGIGDTIDPSNYYFGTNIVDTIYHVNLENGSIVDCFSFQTEYLTAQYNYYIEGVGGAAGLLYPFAYQFEQGSYMDAAGINNERIICFDCYITVTSISGNMLETINIYPNPANDNLMFLNNSNRKGEFKIYTSNGQLLATQEIPAMQETSTIDVSGLVRGMYFLKFESDGNTKSFKLVKE